MEITIRPGLFDYAAGDPVEFGFDQFTHFNFTRFDFTHFRQKSRQRALPRQ